MKKFRFFFLLLVRFCRFLLFVSVHFACEHECVRVIVRTIVKKKEHICSFLAGSLLSFVNHSLLNHLPGQAHDNLFIFYILFHFLRLLFLFLVEKLIEVKRERTANDHFCSHAPVFFFFKQNKTYL